MSGEERAAIDRLAVEVERLAGVVERLESALVGDPLAQPPRAGALVQLARLEHDPPTAIVDAVARRIRQERASDSGSLRLPAVGRREVAIAGGGGLGFAALYALGQLLYGVASASLEDHAAQAADHPRAAHHVPAPVQEPEP